MESSLQDGFGRHIDYLRMSVTNRCDFRCVYCMAEDMTFLPRQQVLGLEELYRLAALFVRNGVKKIRLTGGEPLVRKGIVGLCEQITALPGLRELVMTTNGSQHRCGRVDERIPVTRRLARAGQRQPGLFARRFDPQCIGQGHCQLLLVGRSVQSGHQLGPSRGRSAYPRSRHARWSLRRLVTAYFADRRPQRNSRAG